MIKDIGTEGLAAKKDRIRKRALDIEANDTGDCFPAESLLAEIVCSMLDRNAESTGPR